MDNSASFAVLCAKPIYQTMSGILGVGAKVPFCICHDGPMRVAHCLSFAV